MFIGRVSMIKFVLNQASERAELHNVTAEKSKIMHLAKDAAHLALVRKDREKGLPCHAGVLEGAVDEPKAPANGISELRAEVELPKLCVMKGSDEPVRVLGKRFARF